MFIASARLVALNHRVDHCFLQVTGQDKKGMLFDALEQIIGNNNDELDQGSKSVLVFVNSVSTSNDVISYLVENGISATPTNGFLFKGF